MTCQQQSENRSSLHPEVTRLTVARLQGQCKKQATYVQRTLYDVSAWGRNMSGAYMLFRPSYAQPGFHLSSLARLVSTPLCNHAVLLQLKYCSVTQESFLQTLRDKARLWSVVLWQLRSPADSCWQGLGPHATSNTTGSLSHTTCTQQLSCNRVCMH